MAESTNIGANSAPKSGQNLNSGSSKGESNNQNNDTASNAGADNTDNESSGNNERSQSSDSESSREGLKNQDAGSSLNTGANTEGGLSNGNKLGERIDTDREPYDSRYIGDTGERMKGHDDNDENSDSGSSSGAEEEPNDKSAGKSSAVKRKQNSKKPSGERVLPQSLNPRVLKFIKQVLRDNNLSNEQKQQSRLNEERQKARKQKNNPSDKDSNNDDEASRDSDLSDAGSSNDSSNRNSEPPQQQDSGLADKLDEQERLNKERQMARRNNPSNENIDNRLNDADKTNTERQTPDPRLSNELSRQSRRDKERQKDSNSQEGNNSSDEPKSFREAITQAKQELKNIKAKVSPKEIVREAGALARQRFRYFCYTLMTQIETVVMPIIGLFLIDGYFILCFLFRQDWLKETKKWEKAYVFVSNVLISLAVVAFLALIGFVYCNFRESLVGKVLVSILNAAKAFPSCNP